MLCICATKDQIADNKQISEIAKDMYAKALVSHTKFIEEKKDLLKKVSKELKKATKK